MTNYSEILMYNFPGTKWSITGNDYETLEWGENNSAPKPTRAELDDLYAQTDLIIGWRNIRRRRDGLLAETDWTQLADVPESTRRKWVEYRQQLRDIPQFFDDPDFVVFPDKPE